MIPPRRLYLYRHAKSSWSDPSLADIDRPLNDRGRKAAKEMARHIVLMGWKPDFILCSPARRTRSTLSRLLAETGGVPTAIEDGLYEAGSDAILQCLRDVNDAYASVFVLGHNPGLETLALRLAGEGSNRKALMKMADKFPTASIAAFDVAADLWADLGDGTADLIDFVRPRDLD